MKRAIAASILAMLVIPAGASASPWLSMSKGKQELRRWNTRIADSMVNNHPDDYVDATGFTSRCRRRTASRVSCVNRITLYRVDDQVVRCESTDTAVKTGYGYVSVRYGRNHCW